MVNYAIANNGDMSRLTIRIDEMKGDLLINSGSIISLEEKITLLGDICGKLEEACGLAPEHLPPINRAVSSDAARGFDPN